MEMFMMGLSGRSKRPSNEAADEEDLQAYIRRYAEEDSESRTTLEVCFSTLPCR